MESEGSAAVKLTDHDESTQQIPSESEMTSASELVILDNNFLQNSCGVLPNTNNSFMLDGSVDLSESGILLNNTNSIQVPQITLPSLLPVQSNNPDVFVLNEISHLQSLQSVTGTTTSPIYVVSMMVGSPTKGCHIISKGIAAELVQKCNEYSKEVEKEVLEDTAQQAVTVNAISRPPASSTPLHSEVLSLPHLDISMIHPTANEKPEDRKIDDTNTNEAQVKRKPENEENDTPHEQPLDFSTSRKNLNNEKREVLGQMTEKQVSSKSPNIVCDEKAHNRTYCQDWIGSSGHNDTRDEVSSTSNKDNEQNVVSDSDVSVDSSLTSVSKYNTPQSSFKSKHTTSTFQTAMPCTKKESNPNAL